MIKKIHLSLIVLFAFSGCNLINPKEQTPTYIHLEPFTFSNPDSNITGSSSHDIPSAKITIDDKTIGTFDLPCTVPVIMSQTGKLSVIPMVTNQGIKSYVVQYPFYKNDFTTLTFNPGKIQNFSPITRYWSDLTSATFRMKNNFEEGLYFKNLGGDTTMVVEKDPSLVFEGKNCGAIYINAPKKSSESISQNYFEISNYNNDCYLELDYKSTIPFQIGLQGENTSGSVAGEYLLGLFPKSNWGKIYLSLSNFVNTYKTYPKYYLKFRVSLDESNSKYTDGYVLIDNIKVIAR
ncbi:MAG: hypothetical protein QM530_02230 [Phycisphaerales bacterium]|nr:hypothetical protein [Phycisphaerales bacterium]